LRSVTVINNNRVLGKKDCFILIVLLVVVAASDAAAAIRRGLPSVVSYQFGSYSSFFVYSTSTVGEHGLFNASILNRVCKIGVLMNDEFSASAPNMHADSNH
jgi:hypothetical protein